MHVVHMQYLQPFWLKTLAGFPLCSLVLSILALSIHGDSREGLGAAPLQEPGDDVCCHGE